MDGQCGQGSARGPRSMFSKLAGGSKKDMTAGLFCDVVRFNVDGGQDLGRRDGVAAGNGKCSLDVEKPLERAAAGSTDVARRHIDGLTVEDQQGSKVVRRSDWSSSGAVPASAGDGEAFERFMQEMPVRKRLKVKVTDQKGNVEQFGFGTETPLSALFDIYRACRGLYDSNMSFCVKGTPLAPLDTVKKLAYEDCDPLEIDAALVESSFGGRSGGGSSDDDSDDDVCPSESGGLVGRHSGLAARLAPATKPRQQP